MEGLSPRVRGIPTNPSPLSETGRSIPACTGNPARQLRTWWTLRVYPRVYGESRTTTNGFTTSAGLSPRVRGIPFAEEPRPRTVRSIPACTGNPYEPKPFVRDWEVYPRVYGESAATPMIPYLKAGLSPRVRGIPGDGGGRRQHPGSIPACTGNPNPNEPAKNWAQVYPRVYGESLGGILAGLRHTGLSPRVRGIRQQQ